MVKMTTHTWGEGRNALAQMGKWQQRELRKRSEEEMRRVVSISRSRARNVPVVPGFPRAYIADTIKLVIEDQGDVAGVRVGSNRTTTGGANSSSLVPAFMWGGNRAGSRKGRGKHGRQVPPKAGGGAKSESHFLWKEFDALAREDEWLLEALEKGEDEALR